MAGPDSELIQESTMRLFKPAAAYFGLVFAAGFALGTVRTLWIAPRFGSRTAELLEIPLMLIAIVMAARWTNRRTPDVKEPSARLGIGLIALALLLAAELVVGIALRGASPAEALVNRDPLTGTLYYASLAVFAVLPWLLSRRAIASDG